MEKIDVHKAYAPKLYEVEFISTTRRTYSVIAPSKKFAEEEAVKELQMDIDLGNRVALLRSPFVFEVTNDWFENAEVNSIRELKSK